MIMESVKFWWNSLEILEIIFEAFEYCHDFFLNFVEIRGEILIWFSWDKENFCKNCIDKSFENFEDFKKVCRNFDQNVKRFSTF